MYCIKCLQHLLGGVKSTCFLVGVKYQACLTVGAQNLYVYAVSDIIHVSVFRYLIQINFAFSEVRRWSEEESTAVREHLSSFFASCKVPSKKDCEKCLRLAGKVLQKRSWKDVKNFVHNHKTTNLF